MKNIKKILTYFFGFIILSSCSKLELSFSFAPRFVANSLDNVFDLSSDRYVKIKQKIEMDLNLNKKEILKELSIIIDQLLEIEKQQTVTIAEFESLLKKLRLLQVKTVQIMEPTFAEVLNPLSEKELNHKKSFVKDKILKSEESVSDIKKFEKKSFKTFEKVRDYFFNDVTEEQEKLYFFFINENINYYKEQLEFRKKFNSQFDVLFEKKPELLKYTMNYYSGDNSTKTLEFIKSQDLFFEKINQFNFKIWKLTNDQQKAYFKKTLLALNDEISSLLKE